MYDVGLQRYSMPFKSKAQRRWMHANEPEMAKRWEEHTPDDADLPEHVSDDGEDDVAEAVAEMITDDPDIIIDIRERPVP